MEKGGDFGTEAAIRHHNAEIFASPGIGERLITAKSDSVFGCVYKLAAVEDASGAIIPKIKVSENAAKITNPGYKRVWRFYSNESGKAEADLISLASEPDIDQDAPVEIFTATRPVGSTPKA